MIRSRTSFKGARGVAVGNWWEAGGATGAVAVYQPIGAASLAASYVNLVNPGTFDAAPGVAPTFATGTGWTFNGSTQYLDTGVVPAIDQTWSMIVRFSDGGGTANFSRLCGCQNGGGTSNYFVLQPTTSTGVRYRCINFTAVAPNLAGGVLCIAGRQGYRNGSAEGGLITAATVSNTISAYIGASRENAAGDAAGHFTGNIQAFAIYNNTLTADMVAAVTTAMQAL